MRLHCVCDDVQRNRFIGWLVAGEDRRPWLAVDTETTGLTWKDQLRMVQFGDAEDGWALPYPEEADLIRDVLADRGGPLVAHHAKFDVQFLHRAGFETGRIQHDTRIMAHLLDSSGSTSLKELAVRYLSVGLDAGQKKLRELMRKEHWTWATVPTTTPEYWQYAALDPVLTARLAERLFVRVIERYADLYELETKVWQVIAEAERRGLRLDRGYAVEQATVLQHDVEELAERWQPLLLSSPKQVAQALAEQGHQIPTTAKGNPSVTADVLEQLDSELAHDVLAYRTKAKLLETYFNSFLELADERSYVHPTVNTIGPRTGRMSCEQPNLQNVPRGSFVRPSFGASPDGILVLADYAQIEYRLFASFANEERMIQAFLEGKDMHAETARIILGREPTKEERTIAKTANFAMLYGAGVAKFAYTAGIGIAEAQQFMNAYVKEFPQVPVFMDAVQKYCRANGMAVETSFGRRCPVDGGQFYAGVNYMIQGTAADVLKQAIVRVSESPWGKYFVLPVHDELIFDCPEGEADELAAALPDLMEVRDRFPVPLTVEVKQQRRWGLVEEEVMQ